MKKSATILLSICFLAWAGMALAGTSVTLGWDANTESDLDCYRVYQDGIPQSPDVACTANDSACCTWTSSELSEGLHEWFLTAIDTSQNESGHSNTVSHTVDLSAPGVPQNIIININITVNP